MHTVSTPAQIKRLFKEYGLSPKKWLGQNLLTDLSYLNAIVESGRIAPGDRILEIGAGLGVLTERLAAAGAQVWALEVDSGFFKIVSERFAHEPAVHLIHTDALKFNYAQLAQVNGRLKVVANLPYNISSRLIFRFHELRNVFDSLIILLQKEVAERLCAEAGTKDYGILSVLLGWDASVEALFDIPPHAFYPQPHVVSTVVRISFKHAEHDDLHDPKLFTKLVKTAFQGRRKTLRNTLKNTTPFELSSEDFAAAAQRAHIDMSLRAENLTSQDYVNFTNALVEARKSACV